MQERLDALLTYARAELAAAADDAALGQWRVTHLGRRSELTGLLRSVGSLPREERREAGQAANAARRELEAAFEARQAELRRGAVGAQLGRDHARLPGAPGQPAPADANPARDSTGAGTAGFPGRQRPRGGVGPLQLRVAEHPGRSSRAGHVGHVPHQRQGPARGAIAANPHVAGPGESDGADPAAGTGDRARQGLSLRGPRRLARSRVHAGGGSGHRQAHHHGRSARDADLFRAGHVRP